MFHRYLLNLSSTLPLYLDRNCEADEDEVLLTVGEAAKLFEVSEESSSESSAEESDLVSRVKSKLQSQ